MRTTLTMIVIKSEMEKESYQRILSGLRFFFSDVFIFIVPPFSPHDGDNENCHSRNVLLDVYFLKPIKYKWWKCIPTYIHIILCVLFAFIQDLSVVTSFSGDKSHISSISIHEKMSKYFAPSLELHEYPAYIVLRFTILSASIFYILFTCFWINLLVTILHALPFVLIC